MENVCSCRVVKFRAGNLPQLCVLHLQVQRKFTDKVSRSCWVIDTNDGSFGAIKAESLHQTAYAVNRKVYASLLGAQKRVIDFPLLVVQLPQQTPTLIALNIQNILKVLPTTTK